MFEFLKSGLKRPVRLTPEEYLRKMREKNINDVGELVPDSTPMAPPIGYKKHPSMVEIVRDMVRSERLAQEALAMGHETFEEADDFDVGDDPEVLRSPYENDFDPSVAELVQVGREELERRAQAQRSAAGADPRSPGQAPPSDGPGSSVPSDGGPSASQLKEATD